MADIQYARIVGDWRRVVGDEIVSYENTDIGDVGIHGTVTLSPVWARGGPQGIVADPGAYYSIHPVVCRVRYGRLYDPTNTVPYEDVAVEIDGQPLVWKAKFELAFRRRAGEGEVPLQVREVTFDNAAVVAGEIALTGILPASAIPAEYQAYFTNAALSATVADEAKTTAVSAAGTATSAASTASSAAGTAADKALEAFDSAVLAGEEADRAIGLAGAQDEHIAGTLEDPDSATHAAFKAVGNATYGTKAEVAAVADQVAASPRVSQVLADTRATDARVAITCTSATEYQLWQALGNGRWWRSLLTRSDAILFTTPPGGYQNFQLYLSYVTYPMVGVAETAPSVNASAGTWTAATNEGTFGGTYVRSNITGDKITYTTPADTVAVGLHGVDVSNAGVSRVLIDGDPTLANVLPTAQELVTAGTLPSTVLVANGGPLTPTDRVLDQYLNGTTWAAPRLLAEDLPPGVHTVTVEVTGVKRDAATDNRAYVSGFAYTTRTTSPATPGVSSFNRITAVPRDSAWEFAHAIRPTGASSFIFSGNIHGYEEQTGLTFTLDGQAVTPDIGSVHLGRVLVIDKTSILRHPDTGTTDLANVALSYTLTGNGLRIRHTTDWLVGGSCSAAYPAMFPTNREAFPAGMIDTLPTDLAITQGNGQFKGNLRGNVIGAWQSFGEYAAILQVLNPADTVNGWQHSGTGSDPTKASNLNIEDRAGDPGWRLGKFYVTRISNQISGGVPYSIGDQWRSDCLYRVTHIPRGAYAALSSNA